MESFQEMPILILNQNTGGLRDLTEKKKWQDQGICKPYSLSLETILPNGIYLDKRS